jgi:hypothetical protein
MCDVLISLLAGLASLLRTRASLHPEILALRTNWGSSKGQSAADSGFKQRTGSRG